MYCKRQKGKLLFLAAHWLGACRAPAPSAPRGVFPSAAARAPSTLKLCAGACCALLGLPGSLPVLLPSLFSNLPGARAAAACGVCVPPGLGNWAGPFLIAAAEGCGGEAVAQEPPPWLQSCCAPQVALVLPKKQHFPCWSPVPPLISPMGSRPGAVVSVFLPALPAQGCRVAAAGRGREQPQGEVGEATRAACNVAPRDRASPRPPAAVSRSRAMPPRPSRARREFTAASAAPRRVHLPLVSAASVVVTLGRCSCIDLKKPMHRGIWLIFLWFLLLSSMKLLLRYLRQVKIKTG